MAGAQPCRINSEAPQLGSGRPDPPAHLDDVARAAWDQLCDHLSRMRVLTTADAAALEIYCTVYSRWRSAIEDLTTHGLTVDTTTVRLPDGSVRYNPKGCIKTNPSVALAAACESTLTRLLACFGLTPADRSRVKALESASASKLAKFQPRKA